jgi:hypothetical protein
MAAKRKKSKLYKWANQIKRYDNENLDAAVDRALEDVVVRPKYEGEDQFRVKLDTKYLNDRPVGEIIDELNKENPESDPTKSYTELSDLQKGERLVFAMNRLSLLLERSRFGDYVTMMGDTKRMLYKNFVAGLARGLGYGIGFLVLAAIAIYILQALADLSIPFFADFISAIMDNIKELNNVRHGIN